MAVLRYLQLDVFAPRPGTGNPLGAILDADELSSSQMQALAAWLNLSETVFFLRPSAPGADYHIRIFTPTRELAFAGHPSVGAAWAAVICGLAQPRDGALLQQCAAGLLPVRVSGPAEALQIQLASPTAQQLDTAADRAPEALLALAASGHVPELWDNGARWWLLPLRDASAVRNLAPDMAALADWSLATDATGSANALIGAWLRQRDALPGREGHYVASQGREVGRDGRVQVQVDAQGTVWIGGQVQAVIDGHIRW